MTARSRSPRPTPCPALRGGGGGEARGGGSPGPAPLFVQPQGFSVYLQLRPGPPPPLPLIVPQRGLFRTGQVRSSLQGESRAGTDQSRLWPKRHHKRDSGWTEGEQKTPRPLPKPRLGPQASSPLSELSLPPPNPSLCRQAASPNPGSSWTPSFPSPAFFYPRPPPSYPQGPQASRATKARSRCTETTKGLSAFKELADATSFFLLEVSVPFLGEDVGTTQATARD